MVQPRKRLPQPVAAHVDAHRDALARIASGEDRTEQALQSADAAVRAAWAHADANEETSAWEVFTATFTQIISERLAETRRDAGWTQVQLADAMSPYVKW